MAKPLPLLIGVLGIGATATGGYMLVKNRGSGDGIGTTTTTDTETPSGTGTATGANNAEVQSGQGQQGGGSGSGAPNGATGNQDGKTAEKKLIFETLDEFKKAPNTSECLKTDFSGLTLTGQIGGEDFDTGKPEDGKFFKNPTQDSTPDTKSCLVINWKKVKGAQNDKWAGKFSWLWTFIRDDEGFVNFNLMEPSTTGNKVKFTGVFYLVEKDNGGTNWAVKFKKEVKDKEVEVTSLGDHVPKAHVDFKTAVSLTSDYWDYLEDLTKLNEMCKEGESCAAQPEVKQYQWTMGSASDEGKPVKEWSENLKWWEKIYGVNDHWKLGEKLSDIKGTWKKSGS